MEPGLEHLQAVTRRHFLGRSSLSLGAMAMASLAMDASNAAASPSASPINDPLAPKRPHFAPKAKRVIYIHLTGSPPNLDLFDYKPELVKSRRPALSRPVHQRQTFRLYLRHAQTAGHAADLQAAR